MLQFALRCGAAPASHSEVIEAWRGDAGFRAWFDRVLAGVPFAAFRWEMPPVTAATAGSAFEFVVVDSPELAREADPDAFADHFAATPAGDVLTFSNLGRDAILVVPRLIAAPAVYPQIVAFVRGAPEAQRLALWQAVGTAMAQRLGAKPVWLSTAGAGVAWLHVRLDDRPKYYAYAPYRTERTLSP